MTKNVVSDEQLGILARRQHDLFRRVREGSVDVDAALDGLQAIIEGRVPEVAFSEPRGGNPYRDAPPTPTFEVWKRITIGGKSKEALIAEMESKGFKIGDWARDMMGKKAFTTSPESIELALVRVTVAELGFRKGATTKSIWQRAGKFGLTLCPAEVGPHLRLADADQPQDDWYWVGMEPITDSDGCPNVFGVGRGGFGRWLGSDDAGPSDRWNPGHRLVFVAPGK